MMMMIIIKCEYRPRGSSWALERAKKDRTGKSQKRVIFHLFGETPTLKRSTSKLCSTWPPRPWSRVPSFNMKFSGVTILQGVEFSIFLLIFEWALQQCSATALPVMFFLQITNRKPLIWPIHCQQFRWPWVTLKVMHLIQAFENAVFRTVVQQLTRFQLTYSAASGLSATAEPLYVSPME